MKKALPALLLAALAACSFDYDSPQAKNPDVPDLVLLDAAYVRVRDGNVQAGIQAEKISRFEDRRIMELDRFSFSQYGKNTPAGEEADISGRADSAKIETDTMNLAMDGSVFITVKSEDINIETDKVTWNDSEKSLSAPGKTLVSRSDGTSFSGLGLSSDIREASWKFRYHTEGFMVEKEETVSDTVPGEKSDKDTFSFRADSMSGSKAAGKEVIVLSGHAEVHSDTMLLKADRIEIQGKDNEFVDCSGNVWGMEEEKEIIFETDRLRYDRKLKIARLEGNSTLEDRKNEVVAKGRFIEYNDGTETAIFQAAVRLFKDSIVCRSQYAVYRRGDKTLDLSGFPVVFKKDDEFRAERIRVDLDTEDVSMEGSVSGSIKSKS